MKTATLQSAYIVPAGVNDASWTYVAPAHWRRSRLRFLCRINPPRSSLRPLSSSDLVSFVPMEIARENDPTFLALDRPFSEVSQGFTAFQDGDVVIAKITPCFENGKGGICNGLTNGTGFGTTEFHVLRPGPEISARFLYYATISKPFRDAGTRLMQGSAGQQRVPIQFLSDFVLPFPPRDEQDAIVRFLDRQLHQIDHFIITQHSLIERLEEKKRVVASDIVFGDHISANRKTIAGLKGNRTMPSEWSCLRARYVLWEIDERSNDGQEVHLSMMQGRGLVPADQVDSWRLQSESYAGGKICRPGDLVLNRLKAHLSVFASATQLGVISPDYSVYRMQHGNIARYFELLFKSAEYNDWFRRNVRGITEGLWRLYTPDFYCLPCIVPPPIDQTRLIEQFDNSTTEFQKASSAVEREIELMNEFRSSLVAETITGKIDVRSRT